MLDNPYLRAFLLATFFALIATWTVLIWARRRGITDNPGEHKQHFAPTPTLGGVAVFISFLGVVLMQGHLPPSLQAVVMAGTLMVVVGLIDDLRGVSAMVKLAAIGAATLFLAGAGVSLQLTPWSWLNLIATFLWIGLVASAFNGFDNADGAAPGMCVLTGTFAFLIAWVTWQRELALMAIVLAGASLGFLWYNFPRPRACIFLGDSGSFFLGFILAAMLILGRWSNEPITAAILAVTLLAVPLFDFLLILVLRGLHGHYYRWSDPIKMCAADHTHHRLVALGLKPREALLTLYLVAVTCGSLSVAMLTMAWSHVLLSFAGLIVSAVLAAFVLNRAPLGEHVYAHHSPLPVKLEPSLESC